MNIRQRVSACLSVGLPLAAVTLYMTTPQAVRAGDCDNYGEIWFDDCGGMAPVCNPAAPGMCEFYCTNDGYLGCC